ncbi:DUF1049 domain-containing protein [Pseudolysobacter antarcticus]|uniref:DUF1049 domain-containing protein n=1 Tax=Pseudolysobacter antarcticus TaxID=2511995 RepID=A0A411HIM6_9GAMM|nr:lipopolysaccharide assembly protein LapA domain-containing protein [Pseudolysobacter antarcticus]QBB70353.1 DUF1049 domain-containing protein [Pseudolysobacter antarcticus]
MRFGLIVLILLFAVFGVLFGALNSESVGFDLYFLVLTLPKGAALLCALLLGWLIGGLLVYFGLVLRLRRQLARKHRELNLQKNSTEETAETESALRALAKP